MIVTHDRHRLRKMYADAWQKHNDGVPLTALESQIVAIIALHPEHQDDVCGAAIDDDFMPEGGRTNPYLHLGLHLGLREQIATNRPAGITALFDELAGRLEDPHDAEHRMIECLAETLWDAERHNRPADETRYLEKLRRLRGR